MSGEHFLPTVEEFVASVDKFLSVDKQLICAEGEYEPWQHGRDPETDYLKLPLAIDGEQLGQALFVTSHQNHATLRFHIGIIFECTICRLDFHQEAIHPNGFNADIEGLKTWVRGPHYHPWEKNRLYVTGRKFRLSRAVEYTAAKTFDSSFRWFCAENKIQLPAKLWIELPPRRSLI